MKIIVPPFTTQIGLDEKLALVEFARGCVGIPFVHVGRNRQGLDCAGLLIYVTQEVLGIHIIVEDYSKWPNQLLMREICNKILLPIQRERMEIGDIALMYAKGLGVVHLGFYAGNTLIHASNEPHAMKVVETSIHPDWALRGTYSVPRYEV